MNQSIISSRYDFKDCGNDLFKLQSSNQVIPNKIHESMQYDNVSNIRLINDWMISISETSMLIWKYINYQKNTISTCKEYFLPNSEQLYVCNQAMILYNNSHQKPQSCIVAGDDGVVRFWPEISLPSEYIDQTISGIGSHDHCLLVEKVDEHTLVFIFKSMKIILADIRDYTNSGILFKQFTQSTGIINGIGRCLSSFFVSNYNSNYAFINVKVNNSKDNTELLLLIDNNIDVLTLDLLFNGTFSKAILNHCEVKNSIKQIIQEVWSTNIENLNMTLINFDLCHKIIYIIVEINDPNNKSKCLFLVTYNRNMKIIDSSVIIKEDFEGAIEIKAIDDNNHNSDQPCLLVAVKDDHKIVVIEVLTGLIKAKFNALENRNTNNTKRVQKSVIGWTCPSLSYDQNLIIAAVTANIQVIFIKQKINPFSLNSTISRLNTETNLSNASFYDLNSSSVNQEDDERRMSVITRSTPKSKFDQMGDRLPINMSSTGNKESLSSFMAVNCSEKTEQTVFDEFKKCVMGYWLGYKSLTHRLFVSIIENSQIDSEISIPILTLQIAREIIDELPIKDPRWSKLRQQQSSNEFCFSNKSLILSHQLSSKMDALENLISMLKESNFNLLGTMSTVAPMSVYKCIFMQGSRSDLQLFGDCNVTWNIVNCIGMAKELVEFVKVLNEIMHNNHCPEINAIIGRGFNELLTLNVKLTPLEILSQKISMVPIFINDCCNFLNEKRESLLNVVNFNEMISEQIANVRGTCQLIGRIISTCLRAALVQRVRFETTYHGASDSKSTAASCWITEPKPFGISESIMDIIVNLVDFSRNFENVQLFDLAWEIVSVYLDLYQHRIKWMENYSSNESELQRLLQSFRESRHVLIEKLVEDGNNIEKTLQLADRFQDFYWITAFCEVLDDQILENGGKTKLNLDYYLKKYCDDGFSEFVLDWYQRKLKEVGHTSHGQLLAKIQLVLEKIQKLEGGGPNVSQKLENTSMSGNVIIEKFLERSEIQATRWLHEIEIGDYGQAAKSLLRLGEQEQTSLRRKKNLLSLAKLNCLVGEDEMSTQEIDNLLYKTRAHLELIKFQEAIPASVIYTSLGYSPDTYYPSIEVKKLIKLLLTNSAGDNNGTVSAKDIVQALQLLEFSMSNREISNLTDADCNELLSTIWSQSVLLSNWDKVVDDDDVESTTLYMVFKLALKSGVILDRLMPDMETLFDNQLLNDISQNPEIVYSIKKAFESLNSEIDLHLETAEFDDDLQMIY